ncbi:response regulator transcription factor [Actinomycetospora lutea]|uniref:response regulator transcription factor n=1 Tax=Actinomycetospora lutea TaxID=663604 RepID=UPI0023660932|nr:response regulator transcription factor [Actinomycetospora lutea]MDD7939476.1 response regulator transcription factor [Actinomycetospora lutea]
MSSADPVAVDGSAAPATVVLVVDDHRVFTDALRASLERQRDVAAVVVAHSVGEALAHARRTALDAAIVDLDLPDGSGLDVVAALRELRPATRTIVLTAHARCDLAERAVAAGAAAFLAKEGTLDRVLAALRAPVPAAPVVDAAVPPGRVELTPRECDVLRLLGQGREPARIATELKLSLHTVRGHVKTLMAKLDAHSQLEAVVAAHRRGLISVGSRY